MNFGNYRITGRHFSTAWSPKLPDPNPCYFCLCWYLENIVLGGPIANIDEYIANTDECYTFTTSQLIYSDCCGTCFLLFSSCGRKREAKYWTWQISWQLKPLSLLLFLLFLSQEIKKQLLPSDVETPRSGGSTSSKSITTAEWLKTPFFSKKQIHSWA